MRFLLLGRMTGQEVPGHFTGIGAFTRHGEQRPRDITAPLHLLPARRRYPRPPDPDVTGPGGLGTRRIAYCRRKLTQWQHSGHNAVVIVRISKPWWIVGLVVGLIALAVALARAGLEDADRWSSVISMFVGTTGLALAVCSVVKARGSSSGPTNQVHNTVTDALVKGTALLGRDVRRVGSGRPASTGAAARPEQGPSEVRNEVRGGTFHEPLIMGRDIEDVSLPPPTSSIEGNDSGTAK
ncbi:hypothetical protein ACIA3K_15085 [Micromonospora sp. NPDC051543]|uniref:hypothetical protein n=1 Tax=Micromonospora sp. NPDC051543 TaxID=3364287 RepID=UPI0037B57901